MSKQAMLEFEARREVPHHLRWNPIAIAANPRAAVPSGAGLAVDALPLELIEQPLEIDRAIVNGMPAVHFAVMSLELKDQIRRGG